MRHENDAVNANIDTALGVAPLDGANKYVSAPDGSVIQRWA